MHRLFFLLVPFVVAAATMPGRVAAPADFSRTTIDLGVHVRDIDASVDFYANVVGFTEVEGFNVAADFATTAGLTRGQPLAVRVFVLGEGDSATRLKLMEMPNAEAKESDNASVGSQLGYRYLTIFVANTNEMLRRLEAAGRGPLAEGPVPIGDDPSGDYLTVVRDPDGNLIELIGPRR